MTKNNSLLQLVITLLLLLTVSCKPNAQDCFIKTKTKYHIKNDREIKLSTDHYNQTGTIIKQEIFNDRGEVQNARTFTDKGNLTKQLFLGEVQEENTYNEFDSLLVHKKFGYKGKIERLEEKTYFEDGSLKSEKKSWIERNYISNKRELTTIYEKTYDSNGSLKNMYKYLVDSYAYYSYEEGKLISYIELDSKSGDTIGYSYFNVDGNLIRSMQIDISWMDETADSNIIENEYRNNQLIGSYWYEYKNGKKIIQEHYEYRYDEHDNLTSFNKKSRFNPFFDSYGRKISPPKNIDLRKLSSDSTLLATVLEAKFKFDNKQRLSECIVVDDKEGTEIISFKYKSHALMIEKYINSDNFDITNCENYKDQFRYLLKYVFKTNTDTCYKTLIYNNGETSTDAMIYNPDYLNIDTLFIYNENIFPYLKGDLHRNSNEKNKVLYYSNLFSLNTMADHNSYREHLPKTIFSISSKGDTTLRRAYNDDSTIKHNYVFSNDKIRHIGYHYTPNRTFNYDTIYLPKERYKNTDLSVLIQHPTKEGYFLNEVIHTVIDIKDNDYDANRYLFYTFDTLLQEYKKLSFAQYDEAGNEIFYKFYHQQDISRFFTQGKVMQKQSYSVRETKYSPSGKLLENKNYTIKDDQSEPDITYSRTIEYNDNDSLTLDVVQNAQTVYRVICEYNDCGNLIKREEISENSNGNRSDVYRFHYEYW